MPCKQLLHRPPACSEPPAVERDPRQIGALSEAELEAWWGYDLVRCFTMPLLSVSAAAHCWLASPLKLLPPDG